MRSFDLEQAKAVLRTFQAEIESVKKIRQGISEPMPALSFSVKDRMPEFDSSEGVPAPDSFWIKEDAFMWLYAEAWHFRSLIQRPKLPPIPEYYRQSALPIYQQWRSEEKEVFLRGNIIPLPKNDIPLSDYLQELALTISEKNERRTIWRKSLRCFLAFIRADAAEDLHGTLEILFPYKMEFRNGYSFEHTGKEVKQVECSSILRRVDKEIYPIDILAAAEITENLSKVVLEGRPNSQHSAAEALGFAWICLAVGSAHIATLTRQEILHSLLLSALKSPNPEKPITLRSEYFITIQTLFGLINIPISKTLHDFLIALPRDPNQSRIFCKAHAALLRTFYEKGVKPSKRAKGLGKITFRTFTSQPHEALGHRPSLKKKPSKSKKAKL